MVVPVVVRSRESYRGGGGGSGGAVRIVLRLVRRRWRGREGKVALEVTRPEEKVGVAGSDNGRIIRVLDARTRGTGESVCVGCSSVDDPGVDVS